jgi:hypothetical protein
MGQSRACLGDECQHRRQRLARAGKLREPAADLKSPSIRELSIKMEIEQRSASAGQYVATRRETGLRCWQDSVSDFRVGRQLEVFHGAPMGDRHDCRSRAQSHSQLACVTTFAVWRKKAPLEVA